MRGNMAYREQRFVSGDYLDVNIYPVFRSRRQTKRSIVRKPTKAVQQALNRRNRAREVNHVICANFSNADYYLTLTYAGIFPSEEQARRDVENFLKRYARALAKKGQTVFKYVKTIETGRNGRAHIHLVLTGGLSPKEVQALWGRGYIDCKPLMFSAEGVAGLARYFTKEPRNEAGSGCRRKSWSCSRNCIHPEPKTNDYKYSKKRAAELARESENSRLLEKLYPGYILADCEPFHNDITGLVYISLRLYKNTARLDL